KRFIGIIMKPVADMDLHRYLSQRDWTTATLATLRSWIGCLCSALAYLHQNQCRHKDLKPQNILIDGANVLLADFGTALDWTEAESDVTVGPPEAYTRLYIAPEVALQQPRGTPSDIWSLGCVFLEIATVLSGKPLGTKVEYFQSLGTSTAAYWHNHNAI
ncbi:kinase-like protein, partial [Setomelanomma holmii]